MMFKTITNFISVLAYREVLDFHKDKGKDTLLVTYTQGTVTFVLCI